MSNLEIIRRVHCPEAFIEVGDYGDGPECVELRTVGKESIEYFGTISLVMPKEMALDLGRALVAIATEKGAK